MWSVTGLAPTLQEVIGAGADSRKKREEYIVQMGKMEELRDLSRRKKGKRVEYLLVLYSNSLLRFSQSLFYQLLHYLIVTAAFLTIAFAVNGSIATTQDEKIYNACNVVIDSCFVIHGVIKLLSVYSYAKRLENYDVLNKRLGADETGGAVAKKYSASRIFKNSGIVDCVVAIFCLAFASDVVADWFRLLRIVIISLWALENEPRIAILLRGIAHGMKAMVSLILLMLLINVIFASICVTMFSDNDPYNFGSITVSIWTLFEMSTFDGWSTILSINKDGCDRVPDSDYLPYTNNSATSINRAGGEFYLPVCSSPQEKPLAASLIFLTYIVIVGFVLTSITIGAISAGINERFDNLKDHQHLLELVEVTNSSDEENGGDHNVNQESPMVGPVKRNHSIDDVYEDNGSQSFSFCHDESSVEMVDSHRRPMVLEEQSKELDSFSDVPEEEVALPPRLKFKSAISNVDQFSFRTVKEGRSAEESEHEYEIFKAEVQECLDIMRIERESNDIAKSKRRLAHSASNTYLKGELARTVSGLRKTDMRFNEMKSRSFHILMYKLKQVVYGDTYGMFMFVFIFLAAMFEMYTLSNPGRNLDHRNASVYKFQLFVQLVFSLDIVLRFVSFFPRYHTFLFYQWNLFDLSIVSVLWLPFLTSALGEYFRLLRVLRLVALIKFMKWSPQLAYILNAILSSSSLLCYTVLLMGMGFYYFAVAGVLLFKQNDEANFGKLHQSFLTMVSVATFDNWAVICRTNMYGCDIIGYSTGDADYDAKCTSPHGIGWWACLYFFVFILIENYIMMNLLISIIMTSMEISYKNSKKVERMWEKIRQKKVKYVMSSLLTKKMLAVFVILDFNSHCSISLSASTPLFEYMSITDHNEVVEIFNKIDEDKLGSIDFPEFIELMYFLEAKLGPDDHPTRVK